MPCGNRLGAHERWLLETFYCNRSDPWGPKACELGVIIVTLTPCPQAGESWREAVTWKLGLGPPENKTLPRPWDLVLIGQSSLDGSCHRTLLGPCRRRGLTHLARITSAVLHPPIPLPLFLLQGAPMFCGPCYQTLAHGVAPRQELVVSAWLTVSI